MMFINDENNDEIQIAKLYLFKEENDIAPGKVEAINPHVVRKQNKQVSSMSFEEEDLVLKKIELHRRPKGEEKLAPNQERPCQIKLDPCLCNIYISNGKRVNRPRPAWPWVKLLSKVGWTNPHQ